jgi:putative transposase
MRGLRFANGEFYHIYNRGVDKRNVFLDSNDIKRFFQGMEEFNVIEPIGSIYENSFVKNKLGNRVSKLSRKKSLVNFICYCLNPNHYHFVLEQTSERGVEKFIHRLSLGYTKYFNGKYKRSGVLFQGKYKAELIDSNEYLLHLSAYVNLNDHVHQLGNRVSKLVGSKTSWGEYMGKVPRHFCKKDVILKQFNDAREYEDFAQSSLADILGNKERRKELANVLIEDELGNPVSKQEKGRKRVPAMVGSSGMVV